MKADLNKWRRDLAKIVAEMGETTKDGQLKGQAALFFQRADSAANEALACIAWALISLEDEGEGS